MYFSIHSGEKQLTCLKHIIHGARVAQGVSRRPYVLRGGRRRFDS